MVFSSDEFVLEPTDHVLEETVREVAALEAKERNKERIQDRVADRITAAMGSMTFLGINVVCFAVWIVLNLPGMPTQFDPFPFSFLTIFVPFEAIILAVFVLISENAQGRRADRRARLEMQVTILAEREISKLVGLVAEMHKHLGLQGHVSEEVSEMQRATSLEQVADAVEAVEAELEDLQHAPTDTDAPAAEL
jgi:uncharacterized membrane protein